MGISRSEGCMSSQKKRREYIWIVSDDFIFMTQKHGLQKFEIFKSPKTVF